MNTLGNDPSAASESYFAARGAESSAKTPEEHRVHHRRAAWHFAAQVEAALSQKALAELEAWKDVKVSALGETLPVREALVRARSEASKDGRAAWALRCDQAYPEAQGPLLRRFDAARATCEALHFSSVPALLDATGPTPWAHAKAAGTALLRETRDAFVDVLTFALKRTRVGVSLREAKEVDVAFAASAPGLSEALSGAELPSLTGQIFRDAGLSGDEVGRSGFDWKRSAPGAGLDVYEAWLSRLGGAWATMVRSDAAPWSVARVVHPVTHSADALLFENLLLSEAWLKKSAGLSLPKARELARLVALRRLASLRQAAATLSWFDDFFEKGPSPHVRESSTQAKAQALGVNVSGADFLLPLEGPRVPSLTLLDAATWECARNHTLVQRFEVDFFRNPAAFADLKAQRALGDDIAKTETARDAGAMTEALLAAGRRLVSVLGA